MKPVIMIAWGPCTERSFTAPGMMLYKSYAWAIAANGGIPLVALDHNSIQEYCEIGDGLLMPGGMGYSPIDGQETSTIEGHARKEAYESDLYHAFKRAGKPILGLCDGHHKINCEEGGTLLLNVAEVYKVTHFLTAHKLKTTPGSFINEVWGDDFYVNSYHGFAVDKLGDNLKITACSPEGVPEALEHESLPIWGVQFHPERMRGDNIFPAEGVDGDLIFKKFLSKCAEIRDQRAT